MTTNLPVEQKPRGVSLYDHDENPFISIGKAVSQNSIVGHLLKFTKFGEWVANDVKLKPGTEVIGVVNQISLGWQRWEDNKPTDQFMGLVAEKFKPPGRDQLGDDDENLWEVDASSGRPRDPWQMTWMVIFTGVDDDEVYTYSTSSKGGIKAIGALSTAYGRQMAMHPGQLPIVALLSDSYDHPNKAYGEIKTPVLQITGWVPSAQALAKIDGGGGQEALQLDGPGGPGPAPKAAKATTAPSAKARF